MTDTAIVVFTGRGLNQILREGGSQAWALNAQRARKCAYLVCTQNHPGEEWATPEAPQGTGFLVGKIKGVEPSAEGEDRWHIRISEYARIDVADLWDGGRNPVRYSTLHDLGIDPSNLTFEPVPEAPLAGASVSPAAGQSGEVVPLSITDAKRGLAAYFGVGLDAIEITIRG